MSNVLYCVLLFPWNRGAQIKLTLRKSVYVMSYEVSISEFFY